MRSPIPVTVALLLLLVSAPMQVAWGRDAFQDLPVPADTQDRMRDLFQGQAAYESGDYERALQKLRPLAEQGVATAQYVLGIIYDRGVGGVDQSFAEASKWYLKAAQQDHAAAQYALASLYWGGFGGKRDPAEALKWQTKSAALGHPEAQYDLGKRYLRGGQVVEKDYKQALKWFKRAATTGSYGHKLAQHDLGEMYAHGVGVKQDYAEARKWYEWAAKQGHVSSNRITSRR